MYKMHMLCFTLMKTKSQVLSVVVVVVSLPISVFMVACVHALAVELSNRLRFIQFFYSI